MNIDRSMLFFSGGRLHCIDTTDDGGEFVEQFFDGWPCQGKTPDDYGMGFGAGLTRALQAMSRERDRHNAVQNRNGADGAHKSFGNLRAVKKSCAAGFRRLFGHSRASHHSASSTRDPIVIGCDGKVYVLPTRRAEASAV